MRHHLSPLNVLATLLLVGALASSSWAAPARKLITGRSIKDSSLTSADVKNGSLKAADFAKGQLKGTGGAAGTRGPAGAPGAAGSAGAAGPRGADGSPGATGSPGAGGSPGADGAPGAESPSSGAAQLWLFRDAADSTKVDLLASFGVPQDAALGQELQGFRDDLVYSFHVDQDHDGTDDIRYDLRFKTVADPTSTLVATGPVTSPTDPDLKLTQTYTLTRTSSTGTTTVVGDQPTAPPNLGPRATPNYETQLATPVIASAGGVQVFAGPRRDPAFADASTADLYGLRPFNSSHVAPLPVAAGVNADTGRNVPMVALRLPISSICASPCNVAQSDASVVGVAATTSRATSGGGLAQTSVAGLPLVRELLTPIAQRATQETTPPGRDSATIARLRDLEPARILKALYPPLKPPPAAPHDKVVRFLAGWNGSTNDLPPDNYLKINLAISPTASNPNRLGVIGGDLAGFPNGRRLADDVLDIEMRAFAGVLETQNVSPNNSLSDGVDAPNGTLLTAFPYAATPISGYDATPAAP